MDFDKFNKINKIYRFFGLEDHNVTGLEEEYLWCSKVEDFNDPFEHKIIKEDFDFRRFSREEISVFLESNPTITYIDVETKKEAHVTDLDLNKLTDEQLTSISISLNKVTLESANKLQNSYFHCLSHDACDIHPLDNRLLWSHYASGLRGFVIEFDIDLLLNSIAELNPQLFIGCHLIDYLSTDFETLIKETISESSKLLINDFLFTKHENWKYEEELRLISETQSLKYNKNCITRVIAGEKMSIKSKLKLSKILEAKNLESKLFTASIRRNDFSIHISPCVFKTNNSFKRN